MPHDSEQHAQHDQLIVVAFTAGDLTGTDRNRAAAQIADCVDCARLNDDLLAIARATAVLPPAVRPRDFQLSPEQAARLRPAGWRRFIAAFASPRLAMTRQLGVGLTTIGLAGLLVSVLPTMNLGGAASGPAPAGAENLSAPDEFYSDAQSGAAGAPAAAASATPLFPGGLFGNGAAGASAAPLASSRGVDTTKASPAPAAASASNQRESGNGVTAQGAESPGAESSRDLAMVGRDQPAQGSGVSLLLVASGILLAAGIALLVARRIARGMTRG